MSVGRIVGILTAAVVTTGPLGAPIPVASAARCPSTQVVFARGTGEPAGLGTVGASFVDGLRSRVGGRSVGAYAVSYPAGGEWATGVDGVRDIGTHVVSMAADCPDTRMVLSGYSQGAALMGYVTSGQVPDGVDPANVPEPLQPAVADHVAAVVLFGTPNVRAMNFLGQSPVAIGPLYADKTIQLCIPDDPVCSEGMDFDAHSSSAYAKGPVDQGADFAARRL